jgi:hypothetical protein
MSQLKNPKRENPIKIKDSLFILLLVKILIF